MKTLARKTESLSYPDSPLNAIRDLQDLDRIPRPLAPVDEKAVDANVGRARHAVASGSAVSLPQAPTTGSEDTLATSSAAALATGSATSAEAESRRRPVKPTDSVRR